MEHIVLPTTKLMKMESHELVSLYLDVKESFNQVHYTLNHESIAIGSWLHEELTLERRILCLYIDDIVNVCNLRNIKLH